MSTPVAAAAKKVAGRKPPAPGKKVAAKKPPAAGKKAAAKKAPAPGKKAPASRRPAAPKAAPKPKPLLAGPGPKLSGTAPQRLIVTEFIACVLLVGVSPVLMRKPSNGKLYVPNDFVRISAVSLIFFVLALSASGQRSGRVAAAFGGLITLGVLFNAAGSIKAVGSIFASTTGGGTVATTSAGTTTVTAPTYTPFDPLSNPANPQPENLAASAGITPGKAAGA